MTWDWEYARSLVPTLLEGLVITVEATLIGACIALTLGLVLALLRRSRHRTVRLAVGAFIEFVRSTPLLVQLFALFYLLPQAGITLAPLAAGCIGLGIHYSTYASEAYRAGIEGVPRGQWDAAHALSLPSRRTWTGVVLPQAIPVVVPALGNYVIAMFKDSAILSTITILELLGSAREAGAETFQYLEPMAMVGLFYLTVSYIASMAVRRLERRLALGH